jgi:peptide chain release factor 2
MRIISGKAGRTAIKVPSAVARPTTDFVRQAIFSILGETIYGARVLDLFCGSGALGLEALSRGAASCVFVAPKQFGVLAEVVRELHAAGVLSRVEELSTDAEAALKALLEVAAAKELEALLNGEADGNDTFLEINAGAGGTESCDWASILSRMYVRWAEKKGYKVELQSETAGDEAGIRSVAYKISGHNAYGWLKSESGVHRLVRISPFDSAARRHTSFSSVWVYPVVDDNIDIDIPDRDIRIDTYRSSGAGGQHVNTTDSAVRITHLPTNIVVTSSMKSQHQNREICMNALRSRLYQLELDKRNAAINAAHENKGDAGWGNQIRSYVLQPYQMVKDLRTGHETSDASGVLDGDLDKFMAATLAMDVAGKSRAEAMADE